jgi:hypothetical protein
VKLDIIFRSIFLFVCFVLTSGSRSQKSVNETCTARVHLFLCQVFWLHALEIFMLAKYLFSPCAIHFLQTTRSPSWRVMFAGRGGGGGEGNSKASQFYNFYQSSAQDTQSRMVSDLCTSYSVVLVANCVFVT